jgi:tetrahydromethanopterin S-methyltransferase subunit D
MAAVIVRMGLRGTSLAALVACQSVRGELARTMESCVVVLLSSMAQRNMVSATMLQGRWVLVYSGSC